jgi:sirohydrochlorin ferrochelatase
LSEKTLTISSAYLLVFHGSRDYRAKLAFNQLTQLVIQQLQTNVILTQRNYLEQKLFNLEKKNIINNNSKKRVLLVSSATLELDTLPLHQTIAQFAQEAIKIGCQHLEILPLFLLPGIHVQRDLPAEIARAKSLIKKEEIVIKLHSHLGESPGLCYLLEKKFSELPGDGRILLAHGSRRVAANQACAALAARLSAKLAYCQGSPSLREQIETMIEKGNRKIAILPYLLFPGKLGEAIFTQVQQLRQNFSSVEFIIGEPIGATKELAKLVLEEIAS